MAFWYYEGTKDFVAATPCLILTFKASGSITAGRPVLYDAGDTSEVYMTGSGFLEVAVPAGVALKTVSDNDDVPVLVWGVAKNLLSNTEAKTPGMVITNSGSAFADCTSYMYDTGSSSGSRYAMGSVISGSGGSATGKFMATIDCMK